MRNTARHALLLLLLQSCPAVQADEPSLGEQLERWLPRAAGVAHIEVVDIKEVDTRPNDGPLYLDVRFRILRGTGVTADCIQITKAHGGLSPRNNPPVKPYGPAKLDTFKKGERYWVGFCSQYDGVRCPQGVVNCWPDKDGPKILEEAIHMDHYAHRPQYHPESGLTHSYRTREDKKSWQVRMERDGKLLWEADLPGEKFKGERFDGEWRLLHRERWPSGLGQAEENRSGWYLLAETTGRLESGNGYGLPAEEHRITYALDADSGETAAIWVTVMRLGPTSTPRVIQYFDQKTGKVRREERFDSFESGGLAAGAEKEYWYRKLVRTYDPNTSQLKGEEVFRFATPPHGSTFVPVNKQ